MTDIMKEVFTQYKGAYGDSVALSEGAVACLPTSYSRVIFSDNPSDAELHMLEMKLVSVLTGLHSIMNDTRVLTLIGLNLPYSIIKDMHCTGTIYMREDVPVNQGTDVVTRAVPVDNKELTIIKCIEDNSDDHVVSVVKSNNTAYYVVDTPPMNHRLEAYRRVSAPYLLKHPNPYFFSKDLRILSKDSYEYTEDPVNGFLPYY